MQGTEKYSTSKYNTNMVHFTVAEKRKGSKNAGICQKDAGASVKSCYLPNLGQFLRYNDSKRTFVE